jgi:hypothetical protein
MRVPLLPPRNLLGLVRPAEDPQRTEQPSRRRVPACRGDRAQRQVRTVGEVLRDAGDGRRVETCLGCAAAGVRDGGYQPPGGGGEGDGDKRPHHRASFADSYRTRKITTNAGGMSVMPLQSLMYPALR